MTHMYLSAQNSHPRGMVSLLLVQAPDSLINRH